MPAEGHCNCGSIKVTVQELPGQCLVCYCANCKRAGAAPFSICYLLDKSEVDIQDPNGALKSYHDNKTKSGNAITRQFCGTCGSPVVTLMAPDAPKLILKGALFDQLPPPNFESFAEDKPAWLNITKADH